MIQSVTNKFQNWRYYSNTTNAIYWEQTGLVRENVYLYDVHVSICLADAYEDYNCFGEVKGSERERMQKSRVKTMSTVFFMLKISSCTMNLWWENRL
jgi:hypothetical protein